MTQASDATLVEKFPHEELARRHRGEKSHSAPTAERPTQEMHRDFLFHSLSFQRTILHILDKDKVVLGK